MGSVSHQVSAVKRAPPVPIDPDELPAREKFRLMQSLNLEAACIPKRLLSDPQKFARVSELFQPFWADPSYQDMVMLRRLRRQQNRESSNEDAEHMERERMGREEREGQQRAEAEAEAESIPQD
eukprot:CAMPEP_0181523756 /NCGR_PEP_ID=MMETSP1110-20121109/68065_1 /TAXON_ID=174948 /ORGANISM="Symbiodinium sp., Strain CCMP421" /LENGTH=123 /DNA_ID=CAMNT_0023654437 /DNA_START=49 /DNA_END=420 /DNA_ORIENTATION=+